eukprot:14656-Heterococcus_DN1.PRE.1
MLVGVHAVCEQSYCQSHNTWQHSTAAVLMLSWGSCSYRCRATVMIAAWLDLADANLSATSTA